MTDDLATRLLAAIEAVEKDARAATQGAWNARLWPGLGAGDVENEDRSGFVVYDSGGAGACELADAVHIARQNPKATLIRCTADREIVECAREALGAISVVARILPPSGLNDKDLGWLEGRADALASVLNALAKVYDLTTEPAP